MKKRLIILSVLSVLLILLSSGCGNGKYEESGTLIIDADDALKLAAGGDWTVIDAQKKTSFEKEHLEGAVNIERAQITVSKPVANSLAPALDIEAAASAAGLTADSNVIIYDDNSNMDSGRLAWTLMFYSHKGQVKIVSGGLAALKAERASIVSGRATAAKTSYKAGSAIETLLADKAELVKQIDNPEADVVILDVRTDEEYNAGTIPGSIHIDYVQNNFKDGTYKPVQHIRILYKDAGIMPEDTIIMYCKTSIRAAETYAALYNAGYRNLKIYDGAWLEWSSDKSLPVYIPEVPGNVRIEVQDAS